METKRCKDCGEHKSIELFRPHSSGSKYKRSYCNPCGNKRTDLARKKRLATNSGYREQHRNRLNERKRSRRKDPTFRPHIIVEDCRKSDAKKGLTFDLTIDQVRCFIAQPCVYCGETKLQMTLDRMDNTKGHSFDNVVQCCIRCNMVRGEMPYEAWVAISPAVRKARENGLFADWTGAIHGPGAGT